MPKGLNDEKACCEMNMKCCVQSLHINKNKTLLGYLFPNPDEDEDRQYCSNSACFFASSIESFAPILHRRHVQSTWMPSHPSSCLQRIQPTPSSALSSSTLPLPFGLDPTVAAAALSATAKLLSSVALGSMAALKPNILDPAAVSALSRLTYWIFQPCFLLCSVANTLAAASSGTAGLPKSMLLLMPMAAMIQIGLGSLIAKIVTQVMRFPDEEARDFTMCTTFGNSGPLPLIFADALFTGTVKSDVTACVSFYLLMWSPSFGAPVA